MSYSQKIQTILARSDIKKVTERREFIQNLSDILSNDEAIEEITRNSKSQIVNKHNYITWNIIFLKCHQFIVDETRKNTSTSAKTTMQLQNDCCTLLLSIARNASKPCEVYLKFNDLKLILFQVLESDIFKFVYHIYVNIFKDYILSNRMYRILILYEDWKKMLTIFQKLYEHASIRKDIALQVLQQIVHYGCFQSFLVHDVKMMLPFLLNVFDNVTTDPTILAKPAYKLIYTVCKEIVTDNRKALCEFSEKIVPRMISIDGDSDKYKILLLFVAIHHPNGVTSKMKSAYAHDWKQWRHTMIIIYNYILKNIKNTFIMPNFAALSSEVFKQILEDRIYHNEESNLNLEISRQAKRQRLSSEIKKLSDFFIIDFNNIEIESKWYVGEILSLMINKYPNMLNENDFPSLLEIVSELFTEAIKNERAVDSLCKLCQNLLKTENILSKGLMFAKNTNKYWVKIQHILLRILGLNQNEKEGHKLLQLLITATNMSLINELLCLYINNEIRWSSFSINTLYIACQYINISYYIEKYPFQHGDLVKNRLINWILNIPAYKTINSTTVMIIGKILIYLTLNTWNRDNLVNPINQIMIHEKIISNDDDDDDEFSNLIHNISNYYLSLNLELDIFKINNITSCINNDEKLIKPSLSENTLSFITEKLCELIKNHQENNESISKLIFELTIVATFISNLIKINVESNDERLKILENLFNQSITNLYKYIIEKDLLDRKHMYIIDLIRALITLYETPYQYNVEVIIQKCPHDFLLKSLELLNFENNEELGRSEEDLGIKYYQDIFKIRDNSQIQQRNKRLSNHIKVSDDHVITIGAHKIISLFGCKDFGKEILSIQQRVLKNLLQINIYAPTLIGNFWQALVFLKILIKCRIGFFSQEFIQTVITFIKELFNEWKDDCDAVKNIINILPFLFQHVILTDNSIQEIIQLFLHAHNVISKNKFGSKVCLEFIKSLYYIIQEKSSFKLLTNNSVQNIIITDIIFNYIESYFWIVRFETINILREIFQSNNINISTKQLFLKKIEKCVLNLFFINNNLSTAMKQDQLDNVITTGLYIFGSIINSIGLYQTEALNFLLRLYEEKKVPINIINKILDLAINNKNYKTKLIEINLYSLVTNWINGKCSQKFPWMLTSSTSETEFFKSYMSIFILMKLETHQFSTITLMCEKLGFTFSEIIETNFASIIAWLFAHMSHTSNIDSQKNHEQHANQIFLRLSQNQYEFENVAELSIIIKNKIIDILINIIQRFYDPNNFTEMFNEQFISLPQINLPNFNSITVKKCFYHLEKFCPSLGNCLISYLTIEDPSILQQILLILSNNIYDYSMIEYKLVTFHQYAFFCNFLVQKISKKLFDKMAMYFLKDTCYTLLHLINNETDILPKIIANFFYKFLKNSLLSRSKEISQILDFIVVSLISAIQKNKINKIGLEILNLLITYSSDSIKCAISKLHSHTFPSDSYFDKIRDAHFKLKDSVNKHSTLRNEIEIFLNLKDEEIIIYNYEVLPHLRQLLYNKKNELILMYKDLENLRGFTEDCKLSVLHRLIYKLMKLTENSNEKMSLEIAKCLGELGPANLMTMILYSENNQVKENGNFEERFIYDIIIILVNYLESNNIELKKTSSNALYKICSTLQSNEILTPEYLSTHKNSINLILLDLIRPFMKKNTTINSVLKLNIENCKKYINSQNNLWLINTVESYKEWIVNVSCKILNCFDNFYFSSLISICQLNIEFAELILPKLVYLMIFINDNIAENICKCIDQFFEQKLTYIKLKQNNLTDKIKKIDPFSYKSMKCMLNIINFVRIQCSNNFMLKLNYLYIAKAAQYCSAHFSSIFYAELYCEILKKSITQIDNNVFIIDHICEKINAEDGKTLQNILWQAFKHIGDPDSIHGCGLSHLKHPSSRIQYYMYSQQWDKVMVAEDAELSSGHLTFNGITTALRHSGFDYLLNRFTSTLNHYENDNNKYMYETAWRLSDWNILPNQQFLTKQNNKNINNIINDNYNYYYCHYQALKSLYENDNTSLKKYINNARIGIIKSWQKVSLECSETIYPKLVKLQMLLELEQMATMKDENLFELISSWDSQNLSTTNNDFIHIEPILTQRIIMYKIKNSVDNFSYLKKALINTYLQLSEIAKIQGYTQIATRLLISLAKENNLTKEIQHQLQYRDALLNWTRKDYEVARYLMRDLINKNELNSNLNSEALRIYGNWMAETKSENPQNIIEKYYEKSIEIDLQIISQSQNNMDNLNNTYAVLAQFADTQYQQINTFMKTPQYESLKECAKYAAKVTSISSVTDSDVKRALNTFQRQNTIDVAEYEKIQREQKMYLECAVKYYFITLETGEKHNFVVFRIISLWFNNKDNNELNKLFTENLKKIPSYKFIPLIPQLVPHLSEKKNSIFKSEIYQLLKRCTKEHPHHTLPILLALINIRNDYNYNKNSNKPKASEREHGATSLILEFTDNKIYPIITEMKKLAEALISLAYYKFKGSLSRHRIPESQNINYIKNYQHCIVSTITLNVQPIGKYNDIVSIYKYENYFEGVGGVNAPKKIICIGTDGIKRKQLVKGKDDLKQDAVMQQVFTVMNLLLGASQETKRRKLNIRTYKVIPLSQRSGVLEWCDNTQPIISLVGTNSIGMHKKYYPNDWEDTVCRSKIKDASNKSNLIRKKVYLECCENLHPVLHFFFMDTFPSPEVWFERRLAYVHSIATNSMVGYILGLGDRHFSNILIDKMSAEVIHIDFGIAFEQGKVLPVPETVPFRLTRNIEAAMGVSGVEGVMRKSCEETMTVLRNRKDIIITLLQVLLYDPLFSWTITPAKAWELQSDGLKHVNKEYNTGQDKFNKIAEKALLRIEQKLQGTEDGRPTSIAGQVERLIQEARDPANLSRLFCGWQAYL